MPARPCRVFRRPRVEQDAVGDRSVRRDRLEIVCAGNRNCLHHRASEAFAQLRHACRQFRSVQLKNVGSSRLRNFIEQTIVRIDGQRNDARLAARAGGEFRALCDRHIARARRKKDEADEVRARGEGSVHRG